MRRTAVFALTILIHATAFAQNAPFDVVKEKPGFPGYMYRPNVEGRTFPAILLFHGSEGGNGNFWQPPGFPPLPTGEENFTARLAKHYASLGYVTYALCYFDCRHHEGYPSYPPDELVNVDIRNYVYESFLWLKRSRWVNGKKVAVWGGSRGAELAILFASLLESSKSSLGERLEIPDAVIAESPSDFVAYPFKKPTTDQRYQREHSSQSNSGLSAWTFNKIPLQPRATILTELYTRPSLITFWEMDPIWGPTVDIHRIMNRYDASGIAYRLVEHAEPSESDIDYQKFILALSKTDRTFVEFKGAGHGPPPNRRSNELFFSITNEFLARSLE